MEERLMDDPRKIKVKKNAAGGIADATDELAPDAEEEAEDLEFELPEEEFEDEDLIGLAPSELQKELERRKKEAEQARAERDKLLEAADRLLKEGGFERAEPLYAQALLYDPESLPAREGLWTARTNGFTSAERLFDRGVAEEFSEEDEETKKFVLAKLGDGLEAERAACEKEATPLRERVRGAQETRRGAFLGNRNYYLVRFGIAALVCVLFAVASGISAGFIVRSREITPVVLTAAFGGLALLSLIAVFLLMRKFVVAQRLVRENERLSSTEDGARLEELEEKLETLALLLGGEPEQPRSDR